MGGAPCPRRIALNEQLVRIRTEEREAQGLPPEPVFINDDSNDGSDRGVLFHAFMEMYYGDKSRADFDPSEVVFVPDTTGPARNGDARSQANILASWWMRNFGRRALGDIIAVEKKINRETAGVSEKLIAALGHDEFSGQLDIVTRLKDLGDCNNFAAAFEAAGFPLSFDLSPGKYVIDFKSATDGGKGYKYEYGYQEIAYPWLECLESGEWPVGTIYLVVAIGRKKNPTPTIDVIHHGAPTDRHVEALIAHLTACRQAREIVSANPNRVNRHRCKPLFDNYPWCHHLSEGRCPGY
jgi:hypothetical protein